MKRKDWRTNKERPINYDMYTCSVLQMVEQLHFATNSEAVYAFHFKEFSIATALNKFKIPAKTLKKMVDTWDWWEPCTYNWLRGRVKHPKTLAKDIEELGGKSVTKVADIVQDRADRGFVGFNQLADDELPF